MRCRRSNGKINAQWYGKVDTDLLRQAERGGALRAHDPDDRVHAEAANHKVRHALPKNKNKKVNRHVILQVTLNAPFRGT